MFQVTSNCTTVLAQNSGWWVVVVVVAVVPIRARQNAIKLKSFKYSFFFCSSSFNHILLQLEIGIFSPKIIRLVSNIRFDWKWFGTYRIVRYKFLIFFYSYIFSFINFLIGIPFISHGKWSNSTDRKEQFQFLYI